MHDYPALEPKVQAVVDRLIADLGADLYSCILYGSTVRGGRVAGLSDTNLLLVLRDSKPEAHRKIADILAGPARVSPNDGRSEGFDGASFVGSQNEPVNDDG